MVFLVNICTPRRKLVTILRYKNCDTFQLKKSMIAAYKQYQDCELLWIGWDAILVYLVEAYYSSHINLPP